MSSKTFKTTILREGSKCCIPLTFDPKRVFGKVRAPVTVIKPPSDFVSALKSAPPAWERWRALSYSHQREHVEAIEEARKPETRARRIARATQMIRNLRERGSG